MFENLELLEPIDVKFGEENLRKNAKKCEKKCEKNVSENTSEQLVI